MLIIVTLMKVVLRQSIEKTEDVSANDGHVGEKDAQKVAKPPRRPQRTWSALFGCAAAAASSDKC